MGLADLYLQLKLESSAIKPSPKKIEKTHSLEDINLKDQNK